MVPVAATLLATALLQGNVTTLTFKPAAETDHTRLPLACLLPLGEGALPPRNPIQHRLQELLGERIRIKDKGERIEVDPEGDGRVWKPLSADKAASFDWKHGTETHPLIFWQLRKRWFVASARVEQTVLNGQLVQSLDADLDGRHFGELDGLRLEDSSFYLCGNDPLIHSARGLHALRDASDHLALKAHATLQNHPSNVPTYVGEGLQTLNQLRARAALPPMRIQVPRTLGLLKHAEYVAIPGNEAEVLSETRGRPGYSAEAVEALEWNSAVAPFTHPNEALQGIFQSNDTRHRLLCSPEQGFACSTLVNKFPDRHGGKAGYVWIATGNDTGVRLGVPAVYPAPGQTQVSTNSASEWPISEERPELFATQRGTSIAVYYQGAAWVEPRLLVFESVAKEVKGELFHPDRPAAPKRVPDNRGAAYFWPLAPLKARTRYVVEFSATERDSGADREVRFVWGFVTGK